MNTLTYGKAHSHLLNGLKKRSLPLLTPSRWKKNKLTLAEKEEMAKVLRCRKEANLQVAIMEDGSIDPTCAQPRVVIIGAGLAGLSAANRLLQCGIDNFVILEATDRPGGRIHSVTMGNVICDLGAGKIRGGSPTNSILALAAREGLVKSPGNLRMNRGICLTSSAEPVPKLVEATAHFPLQLIEKQALQLAGKKEASGISLWDFFVKRILQEVELYPLRYRAYAARKMFGLTNDFRSTIGADLSEVALNQLGSKAACFGVHTTVPTGMVGIIAPLLRQIPSCDHVLYCKKVDKIMWSEKVSANSDRVKVLCCDGTTYAADYVIVTLPLGVLKEKAGSMFIPGLNDEKRNAIKKIGYGNICKINVEYEKPFWTWKDGTFVMGWSLAELKFRKSCPDWVKGIGTVDEVAGTQQGLTFSIAGPEADIVEKLSDIRIVEDFTRVTRMFTGDATLPYPVNVLRSQWKSSPFFLGSKPYSKVGTMSGHVCELALPVPDETKNIPAILFAGDATSFSGLGTLEGARESGVREADRILSVTRKIHGRPRPEAFETLACKGPEQQSDSKLIAKN